MFVCPICKVENRSDAKFCRKCGQSRSALEQHAMASVAVKAAPVQQSAADSDSPQPRQPPGERDMPPANAPGKNSEASDEDAVSATVVVRTHDKSTDEQDSVATDRGTPEHPPQKTVHDGSHLRTAEGNSRQTNAQANRGPSGVSSKESASSNDDSPECPACWTVLRSTDKYCCWCGEPQPTRVAPFLKLCLECNTQLPEKANFCFSCGTDVGGQSRRKVRIPFELFREEESEFFPRFDA